MDHHPKQPARADAPETERESPAGYVITDRSGEAVPVERVSPTESELWIRRRSERLVGSR